MENKEPNSNTNTIDDDLCNDTNSFPTSRPNLQDDTENTPPLQNGIGLIFSSCYL